MMNNDTSMVTQYVNDFIVLRSRAISFVNYSSGDDYDESIIWVGLENLYEILLLQFQIEEALMFDLSYRISDNHTHGHNAMIENLTYLLFDQTSSIEVISRFLDIVRLWIGEHWQKHDRALWIYLRRINERNLLMYPNSLHNAIIPRLSQLLVSHRV